MSARACPTCAAPMEEHLDRGVHLDRCADDHGVYFDRGEVERFMGADPGLDRRLLAEANRQRAHSPLRGCPGCSGRLSIYRHAALEAHLCAMCGGCWIDGRFIPGLEGHFVASTRPPRERRAAEGAMAAMGDGSSASLLGELAIEGGAEAAIEGGAWLVEWIGEALGALFSGL